MPLEVMNIVKLSSAWEVPHGIDFGAFTQTDFAFRVLAGDTIVGPPATDGVEVFQHVTQRIDSRVTTSAARIRPVSGQLFSDRFGSACIGRQGRHRLGWW